MNIKIEKPELTENCWARMRAVQDTSEILGKKWRIRILSFLGFGPHHFMDLQRRIKGIGSKMLSQELKELEDNGLVKRIIYETRPITVQYELTPYGRTLENIMLEMEKWGVEHRRRIRTEERPDTSQ